MELLGEDIIITLIGVLHDISCTKGTTKVQYQGSVCRLQVTHGAEISIICRTYQDIVHLSRNYAKLISTSKYQENITVLPMTKLKLLASCDTWEIYGNGWNNSMIKSVAMINDWFYSIKANFDILYNFCDSNSFNKMKLDKAEQLSLEKTARKFQQYFMSDENMTFMINTLMQEDFNICNSIFLEPSCGDGRLVHLLAETVTNKINEMNPQQFNTRIIGCDIDESVASLAVVANNIHNFVRIINKDYFSFLQSDLLHTDQMHFSTSSNDTYKIRIKLESTCDIPPVIVFGGPPYTLGGGTGCLSECGSVDRDGRDLPLRFIVHSVCVLHANYLLFLLPQRYANIAYINRIVERIEEYDNNQSSMNVNDDVIGKDNCVDYESSECLPTDSERNYTEYICKNWQICTWKAPNNEFTIKNRIIRQPVVFQRWKRI
jgi:hypothetical protein